MTADFLFVSNDKYVKNLGICTYSVMHNMCPVTERVRLHVMNCGITPENAERLRKQAARFANAEIHFFNIESQLREITPKVPNNWNRAIYGRLFMTEVLKEYEMERLIYLDCDLLMDRPVTELFTMPLDGKCIAGVSDGESLRRKRALGIDLQHPYINSGVIVIDTRRWLALDASNRIIDYINSFPEKLLYPDQDAINFIMTDEIHLLDPCYNMLWMICQRDIAKMPRWSEDYIYNEEQTVRALYHGNIYHYAGHNMWSFYGITPVHAYVFEKYHKLCDWRHEKRRIGGLKNLVLWFAVSFKRLLIGEYRLTRQKMKEPISE